MRRPAFKSPIQHLVVQVVNSPKERTVNEARCEDELSREICCKRAVNFPALYAAKCFPFCSTTVSPRNMRFILWKAFYAAADSGLNPKVGSSIPPHATNYLLIFNNYRKCPLT
jgi:hypothetical protein